MVYTIAVDLLGTDKPEEMVEGVKLAAQRMSHDQPYRIIPVGPKEIVELLTVEFPDQIVDGYYCYDFVTANDSLRTVYGASGSSVAQSIRLVADGSANGVFLCGDTRSATFWTSLPVDKGGSMGLMPGILHPPLALTVPTFGGGKAILLDAGTSIDCSPEMLVQFAHLGRIFAQVAFGIDEPLIGLHSNGEEKGKGNNVSKEAFRILDEERFPNFIGNVQPTDLFTRPITNKEIRKYFGDLTPKAVDVDIVDGFIGNSIFKTAEAFYRLVMESLMRNSLKCWRTRVGLWLLKPAIKATYRELDPREHGANPLLGTNGLVTIGHGSSDRIAVATGIEETVRYARFGLVNKIRAEFQDAA